MGLYRDFHRNQGLKKQKSLIEPIFPENETIGFFYGPACLGQCGGGMMIIFFARKYFLLWIDCGTCTNTQPNLLSLWCLLLFASSKGILYLQVYGDSKTIVDWAGGKSTL